MDYFQGVVTDYLRADRAMFVNTECCIQLNSGPNPDVSGPHWYCDAVAINLRESAVFLCEISYSKSLAALLKRLDGWSANWGALCAALVRDSALSAQWPVRPWLFVPKDSRPVLATGISKLLAKDLSFVRMPEPKITDLEGVTPWQYRSWNRLLDDADAKNI